MQERALTGVPGLDDVMAGGFQRGRLYLLEGSPGAGKTTAATQFLIEGAAQGERGLYITLSETEEELRSGARSHGWELDGGFEIHELLPPESLLDEQQQQSLLYSSDLELGETTRRMFEVFERVRPDRLVIDSLSEIRLLAQSSLRYRRQILALKHYFSNNATTVVLLDDLTADAHDHTVHSVAHAVIRFECDAPAYGRERRRLRVIKYRGQKYRGGFHDFVIDTGGLQVFPRLIAQEHLRDFAREECGTGNPQLDAILGGGVERGSSALILGPAGTGKSVLALSFVQSAVARGEKAAMFVFDEELGLLQKRALGLGIDVEAMCRDGSLLLQQVDAAELTPGEFTHRVRECVEKLQAQTVVIDSLNGYQAAMPEERALVLHMHELLLYLNRRGASTFLTVAQHGVLGDMRTPVEITYLADTLILLRYFEATGQVRRAISVVKKRTGQHEDTIREFRIGSNGMELGVPLTDFHGVLSGIPTFVGDKTPLLD